MVLYKEASVLPLMCTCYLPIYRQVMVTLPVGVLPVTVAELVPWISGVILSQANVFVGLG